MEQEQRIKELVALLNEASNVYYNHKESIMSDYEWDQMYMELERLEAESGLVLPDSPTIRTGYEETNLDGAKEAHEFAALSLAKSKDVNVLKKWAGDRPIWLSWKLDGITLVATYDKGKLTKLMTRGNGTVGTNITFLAAYIQGIPQKVAYKGHMVVRGEAVISYDTFEHLNATMREEEEAYSNPRNLVAGTLALDKKRAKEVEERGVCFKAFTLVFIEEPIVSWGERMNRLAEYGFSVVDREPTDAAHLSATIDKWSEVVRSGAMNFPVDGLVITYDDTDYASQGSVTGHHATNAGMAFKWQDTAAETMLDHIEWSCAASMICPVAVFDMVQLEGTEVRRASLCNISEVKRLGIGANRQTKLKIIKSNMIIPKCIAAEANGTQVEIPEHCPVCGAPTVIRMSENSGTETLHCTNEDCSAKQIQKFTRFVNKTGMDIEGLSEKTIVKFINQGYLKDFADIYDLNQYEQGIKDLEGFGVKSYENMWQSIQLRRRVHPVAFIYALSIPMIGIDAAKKLIGAYGTEGFLARLTSGEGYEDIHGIGTEKSGSIVKWYQQEKNQVLLKRLLDRVELEKVEPVLEKTGSCTGLTFVITGDVEKFENRKAFIAFVEGQGGTVTGSVSKKTNYLINNDVQSTSGKNKKAQELGIPILSEEDFLARFGAPEA